MTPVTIHGVIKSSLPLTRETSPWHRNFGDESENFQNPKGHITFLGKISHQFSLGNSDQRPRHSYKKYPKLMDSSGTDRLDVSGKTVGQAGRMRTGTPATSLPLHPAEQSWGPAALPVPLLGLRKASRAQRSATRVAVVDNFS